MMSARAYILLDVKDSKSGEVAAVLRAMPGVVIADILEGPPDIVMVVEASERQQLAELAAQALASVETVTDDIRLLPTRGGLSSDSLLGPFGQKRKGSKRLYPENMAG